MADAHKRRTTSVRFETEMFERLKVAAEERGVSVNWLVVYACNDFIDRLVPFDELKLTYSRQPPVNPIEIAAETVTVGLGGFAQAMRDAGIHVGLQGYCVICEVAWPCAQGAVQT